MLYGPAIYVMHYMVQGMKKSVQISQPYWQTKAVNLWTALSSINAVHDFFIEGHLELVNKWTTK